MQTKISTKKKMELTILISIITPKLPSMRPTSKKIKKNHGMIWLTLLYS